MQAFLNWLANSPLATFLKTFLSVILTMLVAQVAVTQKLDVSRWQEWVAAALVSSLPLIINWLNPHDTRYGKT